jgi:hypothetical protein
MKWQIKEFRKDWTVGSYYHRIPGLFCSVRSAQKAIGMKNPDESKLRVIMDGTVYHIDKVRS